MRTLIATGKLRFVPFILLVASALAVFVRTTAALNGEEFLIYGYEIATFGLFAARGTGAALSVFAAGWLIWGGGKLASRLAVSFGLMTTILAVWHRLYAPEIPWNVVSQHASSVLIFCGATTLFAVASSLGSGFACAGAVSGSNLRKWQVSIRDLLVITSALAVVLAMAKGYVPRDISNWRLSEDEMLWLAMSVMSSLLILTTVVICFCEHRAAWLKVLMAMGLSAAIAVLHLVALTRSLELPLLPIDTAIWARGIHHVVHFGWLLAALGTLRLAGFRLCQLPSTAPTVVTTAPHPAAAAI